MAISVKKNVPAIPTTAKQTPQAALEAFVSFGREAATAGLALCMAAVNYFCIVNRFATAGDPNYLSMANAKDALKHQLETNTQLKAASLYRYVSLAERAYNSLTRTAKFSGTLNEISGAATGKAAVSVLLGWLETNAKVKSLNDLERIFSADTGGSTAPAKTPTEKAQSRVKTAITAVEKDFVAEGTASERDVAQAIAGAVSDPLALIVEAIKRITRPADLERIAKVAAAQAETLATLSGMAQDAAKAKAKTKAKVPAGAKGKAKTKARATA